MSYTSWHVGMKVVCVQAYPNIAVYGDETVPRAGRVYTIREIGPAPGDGEICVLLSEIVNQTRIYVHRSTGEKFLGEPGFAAGYFRPVEVRKTDISIFTRMLEPKKGRVGA